MKKKKKKKIRPCAAFLQILMRGRPLRHRMALFSEFSTLRIEGLTVQCKGGWGGVEWMGD